MQFRARACQDCGLRFPVEDQSPLGAECPRCGAPTEFVDEAYETHEASATVEENAGPPLAALLDNIRSVRNVGSMFRTADGAGLSHMHLAGFTPTPEHPQMRKTALGAEASVPWTHHQDPVAAANLLVSRGHELWALEGGRDTPSLFDVELPPAPPDAPEIILVLGHEVSGIDPRVLEQCARVLRIPMAGVKGSLNVGVAFGVAVYTLRHALPRGVTTQP